MQNFTQNHTHLSVNTKTFFNFCENRLLFINEHIGEGDELLEKNENLKINEFLKNKERELIKLIDSNKNLKDKKLWEFIKFFYQSEIKKIKILIEKDPENILLQKLLYELRNTRGRISENHALRYKLDQPLYEVVDRFEELGLTYNPLNASSIEELKALNIQRNIETERNFIKNYFLNISNKTWNTLVFQHKDKLKEMHDNCRMSLCIPAYQEEKIIKKTLDVIFSQKFNDINDFEVIICENSEGELDKTGEIVRQYAKDHKFPNLYCITQQFKKGSGGVGIARKLATDVALARSLERHQSKPFYIASEDADLQKYSNAYVLSHMIGRMDKNEYLDGLNLIHGKMPEIVKDNDVLFLTLRADNFFILLSEHEKNSPTQNENFGFKYSRSVTLGSGAIFSAEALAQIGTYDPKTQYKREDLQIGRLISILRGKETNGKFTPNTLSIDRMPSGDRTNTSPRRNIMKLIKNDITYGNESKEKELRSYTDIELMNILNKKIGKTISLENKNILEQELSFFRKLFEKNTGENAQKLFERFLFMLGFKKGDISVKSKEKKFSVTIENIDNVKSKLEQYRNKKVFTNT